MKNEERRRCGLCRKLLRPDDSISVTEVGERCYRCFNEESADRLGIDFDNTPIAPMRTAPARVVNVTTGDCALRRPLLAEELLGQRTYAAP